MMLFRCSHAELRRAKVCKLCNLRNLRLSAYIACRMGSESRCHFSSFTLDHARHRDHNACHFRCQHRALRALNKLEHQDSPRGFSKGRRAGDQGANKILII